MAQEERRILSDARKWVTETEVMVRNYEKLINAAKRLERGHRGDGYKMQVQKLCAVYLAKAGNEGTNYKNNFENDLSSRSPGLIRDIGKVLERADKLMRGIQPEQEEMRSPLVVLLRLAAECGAINFDLIEPGTKPENNWGRLESFKTYLKKLKLQSQTSSEIKYHPGIPSCIMIQFPIWHEQNMLISSSIDKYHISGVLREHATLRRNALLAKFQSDCSEKVRQRIKRIESVSEDMVKWYNRNPDYRLDKLDIFLSGNDFKKDLPVYIPFLIATFGPNSGYKPACLLDHHRFRAHRPPAAELKEYKTQAMQGRKGMQRRAYKHDGCAEWSGFIECASLVWPKQADEW